MTQNEIILDIQHRFPELQVRDEIKTDSLVDFATWDKAVRKTETEILSRRKKENLPLPQKKERVRPTGYTKSSIDIVIPSIKMIIDYRARGQHRTRYMLDNAKVEALRQSGWDVVVVWDTPEFSQHMIYSPKDRKNRDYIKKIKEKLRR